MTRFLPPAHQERIEAVRYYNAQRIQPQILGEPQWAGL